MFDFRRRREDLEARSNGSIGWLPRMAGVRFCPSIFVHSSKENMEKLMKKRAVSSLVFMAFLGMSSAWADDNANTSQIDQIGSTIAAQVLQTGNGNTNTSDIDQGLGGGGDTLTTFVEQRGQGSVNDAHVAQDGFASYADILQRGQGNSNTTSVTQDGTNNEAFVTQRGSDNINDGQITQTGTGDLNAAVITQGGSSNSNTAGIVQSGSGSIASVIQN
jgi:hypothetical protein